VDTIRKKTRKRSRTQTYYVWQNLKRSSGGVCLSWRSFEQFVIDVGMKPSDEHWLFRQKIYQRSGKHNTVWKTYKREMQPVWKYLTFKEIENCQIHIGVICQRGKYDLDVAINEFYHQDFSKAKDPVGRAHSFIKRYLPKTLAILKKKRREVQLNEKT
jgi:hypothetical protein